MPDRYSLLRRQIRICFQLLCAVLFLAFPLPGTSLHAQERDSLLPLADSLLQAGSTDSALLLYDRILGAHPDDPDGLYGRGVVYLRRNEFEKGRADLNKALARNPKCASCYVWLGRAAISEGKKEEGMRYAEKAIAVDSSSANAWNFRANLQTSLSAALDDFNRAVELAPDDPYYVADRGSFYYRNSSPMMALQDVNSAIALDSTFAAAYYQRAYIHLDGRDSGRAFQDIDRAIKFGFKSADAFSLRARINEGFGRIDSAIADYTAGVEQDPSEYRALHSRAILRFAKEDMEGACEDLNRVLELIGDDPEARAIAVVAWDRWCDTSTLRYFFHRGIADYNLGNYAQAIEWYNRGLKKFPESIGLRDFRGNAALMQGRFPLAVQDYEYVLARFDRFFEEWWNELPESPPPYMREELRLKALSGLYSTLALAKGQTGDFDRAVALIDSAIAIERDPAPMYNQRGLTYLWAGEWKKALRDFETALSYAPDNPEVLTNRAIVYLLQGTYSGTRRVTMLGIGISTAEGRNSSFRWPVSETETKADLDLVRAARADLDRAIALNNAMGQAYEFRAYARKLLGEADYCEDMIKARATGPESGLFLTPECR